MSQAERSFDEIMTEVKVELDEYERELGAYAKWLADYRARAGGGGFRCQRVSRETSKAAE
jgi:hypothetical protein